MTSPGAISNAFTQSLFSVAGKNVLVTGGSRGIGEMIARGFAQAGAHVLITSRDEKACRETATAISAISPHPCQYVTSTLSTREGCESLAESVGTHFPNGLHVLINNAGTSWGERTCVRVLSAVVVRGVNRHDCVVRWIPVDGIDEFFVSPAQCLFCLFCCLTIRMK